MCCRRVQTTDGHQRATRAHRRADRFDVAPCPERRNRGRARHRERRRSGGRSDPRRDPAAAGRGLRAGAAVLAADRRLSTVLSKLDLNRALLARQLLLDRVDLPVPDAIEQVAGVQAQASAPPFVGLWTRLREFDEVELQHALDERVVVRGTLMRHTIHFVTARDYVWLRPTIQRALDANYGAQTRKRLAGFPVEPFLEDARAALAEGPRTFADIQKLVEARDPDCDVRALAYAVRTFLYLIGVPNQSRWRFGGRAPFVLAEDWLGRALGPVRPGGVNRGAALRRGRPLVGGGGGVGGPARAPGHRGGGGAPLSARLQPRHSCRRHRMVGCAGDAGGLRRDP